MLKRLWTGQLMNCDATIGRGIFFFSILL